MHTHLGPQNRNGIHATVMHRHYFSHVCLLPHAPVLRGMTRWMWTNVWDKSLCKGTELWLSLCDMVSFYLIAPRHYLLPLLCKCCPFHVCPQLDNHDFYLHDLSSSNVSIKHAQFSPTRSEASNVAFFKPLLACKKIRHCSKVYHKKKKGKYGCSLRNPAFV